MVLTRCDGKAGKNKACRIHQGAKDDSATVTVTFSDSTEDWLPYTPSQILDRDSQRKIGARPAKFRGDGDLKQPKAGADAKAHQQD